MNEIVKVIWGDNPDTEFDAGLVVGCDPDIGITVVNADDPEEFLVCTSGPLAPNTNKEWPVYRNGAYALSYNTMSDMIASGLVDLPLYERVVTLKSDNNPQHENCPFGQ